jgi:hypothetical protein
MRQRRMMIEKGWRASDYELNVYGKEFILLV